MSDSPNIDEAIDTALTLLERGVTDEVELVSTWIVDNLVHIMDMYKAGHVSTCSVAGYEVCQIGDQIALTLTDPQVMTSEQARKLGAALLRAAEAADG